MRLYKIVLDGQIIYLEPSLGPETEWPVGLIPSKEEKPVLKPLFKRFEDEIKIAESTTQDIVLEDGKVEFIYSEEATKCCKISTVDITLTRTNVRW